MSEKEKYVIEVIFAIANELLEREIHYNIELDPLTGSSFVSSMDSNGLGAYNFLYNKYLKTIEKCFEEKTKMESCVKVMLSIIDKDEFIEKNDDPFWYMKK